MSSDQDSSGANEFSNDGSFIERFRQLQQKAKQEEKVAVTTTPCPVAVPKSVPFRLAGKKRVKPTPSSAQADAAAVDRSGRSHPRLSTQG